MPKTKATTIEVTKVISSIPHDGFIVGVDSDYSTARSKTEGFVYDSDMQIYIGQYYDDGQYHIERAFLMFDTSIIPEDATITEAILSIYVGSDLSDTDFNVTIRNGQPTYPHIPLESGDYYIGYYSGNGGSRNTSEISATPAYWNITLNSQGISWINKEGYTKLALFSNRDINGQAPTGNEDISIGSADSGAPAKLYITYETEGYEYVFYGPFNEETGLKHGNVTVTVYPAYGAPFNFTLDGTYTLELEEKPVMFKWTLEYNYSRVYIPLYSYEEIYVFIPESPYFFYTVEMFDFIGLHNVYIETLVSANGSQYIAERRRIPVGGKATFCLTEFKVYSFRLISDEAIISLGAVETPQRPIWEPAKISFIITPAMLQAEPTNYEGISIAANRVNETCIQVVYADSRNRTQSVEIIIYSMENSVLTEEYSQNFTAQQIAVIWNDALPNKDYLVEIQAEHADYGTLIWKIPCKTPKSPSTHAIDWNTVFGWVADWPITPSNLISTFIIFAMIVLGSFKDSAFALLLGVITAGILIGLGWFSMSWAILSVIASLIIAYAIAKGRRRWIER